MELNIRGEAVLLLESFTNGGSQWYRLYSDGFLEQGGRIDSTRNGTITLYLSYINNLYCLHLTPSGGSNKGDYIPTITNKTASSFDFYFDPDGGNVNTKTGYWSTKGYIDSSV